MAERDTRITMNDVGYQGYLNREKDFSHHPYDKDMMQYELMRAGDPKAVEVAREMMKPEGLGHLSDDPLRNAKYLFVCGATLACRYAITGGMPGEKAYNASDLYIQRMDKCQTVQEVKDLQLDMMTFYTNYMAKLDKSRAFSKPVVMCLDYIYDHLNQTIRVEELAREVGKSPSYLSTLFKKEMGVSISAYITGRRVKAACNMLQFSGYSYAEIADELAISSQSHLTKVVKEHTGYTPKAYRAAFFRR